MVFVMTGDLYRNSRALKQLRSLASHGWHVEVLFLEGDAAPIPLPEAIVPHPLPRPRSIGPQFFWDVHGTFAAALDSLPADVFHASDLYALKACRTRADKLGVLYTYDAREYYPHVAGTVGKPWARWWWARQERKHIRGAAAVFTVSDSIALALARDYGIERPTVVHNAPERAPERAPDVDSPGRALPVPGPFAHLADPDTPVILHLGQMKAHRGGSTLIRAMAFVPQGVLVFLGYGSEQEKLARLAEKIGVKDRVHFLPPVSPDAIRETVRHASIGVTLLEDTCLNHRYALPNKLFDYIHAGIPVLASDLDETKRVVERYGIGETAPADDPEAVGRAITGMVSRLADAPWQDGLTRAAETFNWGAASQRFLNRIDTVMTAVSS